MCLDNILILWNGEGGEQEILDEEGLGNFFADTDNDMGEDGEHHGNSVKVIGK